MSVLSVRWEKTGSASCVRRLRTTSAACCVEKSMMCGYSGFAPSGLKILELLKSMAWWRQVLLNPAFEHLLLKLRHKPLHCLVLYVPVFPSSGFGAPRISISSKWCRFLWWVRDLCCSFIFADTIWECLEGNARLENRKTIKDNVILSKNFPFSFF